tara:strand:- start:89025 stop:89894 length:870 start_codon:yes stop_codon:yes gene_type:complete
MEKNILITGAFGQLGSVLTKKNIPGYKIVPSGKINPLGENNFRLDIRDLSSLKEIISYKRPEIIIHLAALTSVDNCELNPRQAKEINVTAVKNLCDNFSGKIVYLSTDYVFDGSNGPYSEFDKPCPINVYGSTKLRAEEIIMEKNSESLILRCNVLYDYNHSTNASFLNWVINSLQRKQKINVVYDQVNNPTWAGSLAKIIRICIESSISGVAHWGDADFINRFEFANMIADKFELDKNLIKPISTFELEQPAKRPLNSGLISDKLSKILGVSPPSIDFCLNEIKKKIK